MNTSLKLPTGITKALVIIVGCAVVLIVLSWWSMSRIEVPTEAPWLESELRSAQRDRLIATMVVGINMAVAGVLLRTATKNPLADPEIVGVNAGAAFGAVLATGASLPVLPAAFIGAVVAAFIAVFFGLRGATAMSETVSSQRMVLLGMAVSALFSALTAIALVLDEAQLATVLSWLSGRLGGVRLEQLTAAVFATMAIVPVLILFGHRLDTLGADDRLAHSIGASPKSLRLVAVSAAVLLIAPSVAATGPIGFLGLMAAVAAHRVCGSRHRIVIPLAAVIGACVLMIADLIGQVMWAPAETPVGIVTALAGVPVLLWGIRGLRSRGAHA